MFRYKIVPVTPLQQNCTLFWRLDTKRGGVVDPGGDLPRLREAIAQDGIILEKILVTHGHLDHAGGVKTLADELNIPIIGPHREDKFWIDGMPDMAERFGMAGAKAFEPDSWLEDGDSVDIAGSTFEVLHCPGHTPGHVVFFHRGDKVAMVGDVLFKGSIGRTDLPKGNHQQLIDAIRTKLWPLGNDVTFIPGHGPTSTFGFERQYNGYVSDDNVADDSVADDNLT